MSREGNDKTVDLPESFGNYRLVERLAIGGMAEIFRAKTRGIEGFEKVLVVKRLHERLSRDDDFIEMMIDEAKIAVRLNHPNIAQIFDLGRVGSQYFIAMEYIEGPDLGRIIEDRGRDEHALPVPAILHVGAELCAGLHYAHTRTDETGRPLNIVHRDISPPNVMLSVEGEVKIVDFGIAKARERIQNTQRGRIKGKFHYMAPEQARAGRVDARTDVFSTGMVLYELLAGVNPYEGVDDNDMLERVQAADVPPLEYYWPSVDPELDHLIQRAVAADPSERFQNARALEQALVDYRDRKLESFGRRRLARSIRQIWEDLQADHDEPNPDDTGRMTPFDYEANESSLIFDAGEEIGAQFGDDPPTRPVDAEEDNPFDEDQPTQVWRGSDGDQSRRPTSRPPGGGGDASRGGGGKAGGDQMPAGGDSEPGNSQSGGNALGGDLPPPPSDDNHFAPEDVETDDEESTSDDTVSERPRSHRPEPTSPSEERRPPAASIKTRVRRLVTRLEDAGLDRRAQRMLLAAFGVTGVVAGLVALVMVVSGPAQKSISAAAPVENGEASGATVEIASEPRGATVELRGEEVGETPVTLDQLEVGKTYRVALDKKGFEEAERVFVGKEDADPIDVDLDRRDGRLRVTTEPEGATVTVDGDEVGRSPVEVDDLAPDEAHEVEVAVDERRESRTVEWDSDEPPSTHLAITLPEAEDDESVEGDESDRAARAARDPEPSGSRGQTHAAAETRSTGGARRRGEGASNSSETAEEEPPSTSEQQGSQTTDLDLWDDGQKGGDEGQSGHVSVQVEDGWGKVYVDGELVASETPVLRHELEAGTHEIRIYYPVLGRSSETRTVEVEPGEHAKEIFSP